MGYVYNCLHANLRSSMTIKVFGWLPSFHVNKAQLTTYYIGRLGGRFLTRLYLICWRGDNFLSLLLFVSKALFVVLIISSTILVGNEVCAIALVPLLYNYPRKEMDAFDFIGWTCNCVSPCILVLANFPMLFVKANAQMFNFSGSIRPRKGGGLRKWLIVANSLHVLLQVGYFRICLHLGVVPLSPHPILVPF